MLEKVKLYYKLTKPGIVRGNLIAVSAGFWIGSNDSINWGLYIMTLFASALVIGSGCVLNNFIDRDIDKKMTRTKNRALASHKISAINSLAYGLTLGIIGFSILAFYTNMLSVYAGLFGYIFYVYIYGYVKRRSEHGTLVGSLAGAVPPLVGYLASRGQFDKGAVIVFLILAFWQMPHFYAITIFRLKEYKLAGLPVLSVTRGINTTKKYILVYMIASFFVTLLPVFYLNAGIIYLIVVSIAYLYWMYVAFMKFNSLSDERWARKIFGVSLMVLTLFSVSTLFKFVM